MRRERDNGTECERKGKRMSTVIIKGNLIHTPEKDKFEYMEHGYLVAEDNRIVGMFQELPEAYRNCEVTDYGDQIVMPGMYDMHVHAPQFVYRGLGLDLQLMQWLEKYAFPTEARFEEEEYARTYYRAFVRTMKKNGTARAAVFSTIHSDTTDLLMDIMEEERVGGVAGKINMDTLCPDFLKEDSAQSVADTEAWLVRNLGKRKLVRPAVTPRFIPTCSSEVLEGIGKLAEKYGTQVHSHMSEDLGEMEIVRERYPEFATDAEVYDHFGLLNDRTVMAHFIYPTQEEMELVKERGVTIAHCPQSNLNVAAGIPPIRRMLDLGIRVGLGSDIAGGYSPCIFRAMSEAVYLSKQKWLETGKEDSFLTVPEAFYLGTKGGGQFFGKVGSFEEGYELDALVIDDSSLGVELDDFSLTERMERIIHLGDDRNITARYVAGELS